MQTISSAELARLNKIAFRRSISTGNNTVVIDLLGQAEELKRYPQETAHLRRFYVAHTS